MLFCITATFTPKAMNAIRQNPKSNYHDSVEQLVKAAGGKLVGMYGTMANGPGALIIIDVDQIEAAAITGTLASSDSLQDIKVTRLFTQDEVTASREKRVKLHASFKPPGQ
jgi:uncharacterized protein with GYD domain